MSVGLYAFAVTKCTAQYSAKHKTKNLRDSRCGSIVMT